MKRRVLLLAPFPPRSNATHGGSRAIAGTVEALARRHRMAVAYLRGRDQPAMDERLQNLCDLVREVRLERPRGLVRRLLRHTRNSFAPFTALPTWAAWFSSTAYADEVRRTVAEWAPDLVQLEFHLMGQYLPALRGSSAPRILVQHEPGAATQRERLRHFGHLSAADWLDLHAWRRYEARIMREVHAVVVFTERDRANLIPLAGTTPIVPIGLGVEIPPGPLEPADPNTPTLLFVGSFAHRPNADAARRIIQGILPRVHDRHPGIRLILVGTNPPADVRSWIGPSLELAEAVPDVAPYLRRATIVLAPLRLGGGMRLKVLEALAAGKTLVASPLAVAGLDLVDGRQCVLAESDEEFAAAITDLLGNPSRRNSLSREARQWAEKHLTWSSVADRYDQLYDALLGAS
jgi:glycosyltransferase involved in cell wall biosynthesis